MDKVAQWLVNETINTQSNWSSISTLKWKKNLQLWFLGFPIEKLGHRQCGSVYTWVKKGRGRHLFLCQEQTEL